MLRVLASRAAKRVTSRRKESGVSTKLFATKLQTVKSRLFTTSNADILRFHKSLFHGVEQLPILIQDQQWESVLAIVDRYFEGMRGNHVPAELAIEQSLLYHSRCKLLALIHLARHDELLQFVKDFEDRWPSADPVTILFAKAELSRHFGHTFDAVRFISKSQLLLSRIGLGVPSPLAPLPFENIKVALMNGQSPDVPANGTTSATSEGKSTHERSNRAIQRAPELIAEQNWPDLFSLVNDALLNDYENAELWKLRAQCLEHIDGRLDDALEAYEQYFHHMKSTDDPIAELHRIIVMLRLGRHEEAYPMFDTVLPKLQKEQRALALVHKAAAAYALQRYVEALSAADHSLLGKIPEGAKPLALRYKAASLIKLNRATEGLEIIDSIDTKDLGTTLTSFLLKVRIDALIQLDRSQDALAVFEQLQQSGSEDPELPFIRAQLLVATDKPAEGLEEAMKLSEKHPENIILMRTKALALTKLNKPAEAAPIWQALIMKNHRDISASMWYAVCLFGMGNHIEAVARLESLLPMLEKPGLESMLSDALTYYGQSLFLLRSYERAITPLQRVAQMKPTKIVLKQLAASWMYMQNYGEALRWTEQALLANPNDSQLKRMKVQLIDIVREQNTDDVADDEEGEYDDDEDGEEGEYGGEDAVAGAGDSRQASPEDIQRAHKHLAVGLSSYYNGNYKKALDHINNALEVFPEFAEAWEIRAQCLQKLGRNNEAFEAAQIARRIKSMDD